MDIRSLSIDSVILARMIRSIKIFLEELIEFTCYFQDIFSENVNRSRIFGNQLKMEPLTPIFRLLLWLKAYNVSSENLILDQQKIP